MDLKIITLKEKTEAGLGNNALSFGHLQFVQIENVMYVYAGLKKDNLTMEDVRFLGGKIRKAIADFAFDRVWADFKTLASQCAVLEERELVMAFMEGWYLGGYQFLSYKKKKATQDPNLVFENAAYEEFAKAALIRAKSVNLARDLCNEPANKLTPAIYAERIKEIFAETKIHVEIIEGSQLLAHGFEAIHTVGRGSAHEPKMAVLTLKNSCGKHVALVGKGVTFDTGGTNVKTGSDIGEMKMDMGGSAAVVGAMKLLADMDAPVHVTAVLPLVENITGGNAYLPSDVISYKNGLTVEVGNTDAEGRLILADGILHAQSLGAETIVDIATLTGAIGQALGLKAAGIFSNEEEELWILKRLGEQAGDHVWPMPVIEDYQYYMQSSCADVSNMSSSKYGGAITAAVFLSNFIEKGRKWIHIDMANTVSPWKEDGYYVAGASGFGVRLLVEIVCREGEQYAD